MKRFRRATEESTVTTPILVALSFYREIFCFRARAEEGGLPPGTPDILGVLNSAPRPWLPAGRAFAIETKFSHRDACKCRSCTVQRVWRDDWVAHGGRYILARTPQEAIDGLFGRRAA